MYPIPSSGIVFACPDGDARVMRGAGSSVQAHFRYLFVPCQLKSCWSTQVKQLSPEAGRVIPPQWEDLHLGEVKSWSQIMQAALCSAFNFFYIPERENILSGLPKIKSSCSRLTSRSGFVVYRLIWKLCYRISFWSVEGSIVSRAFNLD